MSHELYELDHAMYGSNTPAWHGLGTVLDGQPDGRTAQRVARLDWTVDTEPVLASDGRGGTFEVADNWLTVRTDLDKADHRRVLGVVGNRYEPIQNTDLFEFADALIGEGGARFETAGSLRNGKIVWALAALPDSITVKDDTLRKYLLLKSTHDGTGAMNVLFTPVRVVCWNTLTLALGRKKAAGEQRVSIRHTAGAKDRIQEARRLLGLAGEYFDQEAELLDYLAGKTLTPAQSRAFLLDLIPDPKGDVSPTRAQNTRKDIARLYMGGQRGANQEATKGTAYGMLNAVAEFADHHRTVRSSNGTAGRAEARMESVLWGSAADLKQTVADKLLAMLDLSDTPAPTTGNPPVDNLLAGLDLN